MEGTTAAGDRGGRLEGETLRTSSSAGYAGTWWSRTPEGARTSSGCSMNPMGAADLQQIRWFPDRPNTLRCRLDASWFAQTPRARAREGTSGSESPCDVPGMMCFEGGLPGSGTTAVEPGRKGTSAFEAAELSTSYSSEFETVEHRGRRGARDAATRFRPIRSKEPESENPRSGSGPSESARPEGEQPVEGVRNPEDGRCRAVEGPGRTDPSADAAEGARNPRRGDPVLRDR
jgi:hypothetical protein